jgi:hypothetical protein
VISDAPLPAFDEQSAPFWEACGAGELRIQRCSSCRRLRMPPRPLCPWCGSFDSTWSPSGGTGRIWSVVVAHPPLLPAFAELAPYNVIVVQLDDDPGPDAPPIRLVGNLVASAGGPINEVDPSTIAIDEPVRVAFGPPVTDNDGAVTLPRWVRA